MTPQRKVGAVETHHSGEDRGSGKEGDASPDD